MKQLPLRLEVNDISPHREDSAWIVDMLSQLGVEHTAGWPDWFGSALRNWIKSAHNQLNIRTLSLFSGGGGLDIAFHDAGFNIVKMIEIDADYVETLKFNSSSAGLPLYGATPVCIDIRDFDPKPDLKIDFIIGGPPCQTFSAAGRRAAGVPGTSDPRGTLFEEYVRILDILKPRGFLFENVYGIVSAQKGQAWEEIQNAFRSVGYDIFWRILDAADYGVPQHRERLFIIGLRDGSYKFPFPTHGPDSIGNHNYYVAGEAVEGVVASNELDGISGKYGHLLYAIPPGLNYSFYTEKMGHPYPVFGWRAKFSDFLYKADPLAPTRTIKAQGGQYTGPFSWENRRFSIDELKRLQTFPDNFQVVGSRLKTIEQIGNSVPPQIGRILALSILDQVYGLELPFPMYYMDEKHKLGFRQRKRAKSKEYQEKAKEAIQKLKDEGGVQKSISILKQGEIAERITRYLSWDMKWTSTSRGRDCATIEVSHSVHDNEWIIEGWLEENKTEQALYTIQIESSDPTWILPVSRIKLIGYSNDDSVFTGLYKALDERLSKISSVADLVQFRGYYQYLPRIQQTMFISSVNENDFLRVLQSIVNNNSVAGKMSSVELAHFLSVSEDVLLPLLERLKRMGYEIRNHKTNPQIGVGYYLIPYTFPTLTERSVQLHKPLQG